MTQNKEATMPYTYPDVLRAVKMSASDSTAFPEIGKDIPASVYDLAFEFGKTVTKSCLSIWKVFLSQKGNR